MEKLMWKYRKCEGLEAGTGLVLEGQGGSQCGWDGVEDRRSVATGAEMVIVSGEDCGRFGGHN